MYDDAMRVDRKGFLLAVTAIAACGAPSSPSTLTVAISPQPTASPLADTAIAAEVPKPIAPTHEGTTRPIATVPTPSDEGSSAPGPSDEGHVGAANEGVAGKDSDAQCRVQSVARPTGACSDDRGNPGDCKKAMCSMGFICEQCEAYKNYFKPKIAERAVACVVAQTRTQSRDGCRTYQCGDQALKSACVDATADVECKGIAKRCKTSVAECRGMLSGMNAAGRANIAACAAKGCPYGLWSCIEGI